MKHIVNYINRFVLILLAIFGIVVLVPIALVNDTFNLIMSVILYSYDYAINTLLNKPIKEFKYFLFKTNMYRKPVTEIVETENTDVEKLTEESLFEKLVNIFNETWELDMNIKDLIDQAKEDGVEDVTLIKSIAKAKAYNKISDLEDKAKAQLEKIQALAG